jgi:4-hydroxy-2-oxoheptanedioate aldolase
MRQSRIRKQLQAGKPVLVTTLHLADASVFELASLMGFDGIWLDLEHHAHSLETAQSLMRAARVGSSDVIARPAKGEFMRMGRLLEAGAQGIMYPRCDSAAEAREVVKWSKFPPIGKRGCDGGNADMPYLSMPLDLYLEEANRQTFVVIQIEDQSGVDDVEEIAAVEGVDVIFLGPGDFSSLSGFPGQLDHPLILEATRKIASAARLAGKHWGMPVATPSQARTAMALGARFIASGADIATLKKGFESLQHDFSELGFEFSNELSAAPSASASISRPNRPHVGLQREHEKARNAH